MKRFLTLVLAALLDAAAHAADAAGGGRMHPVSPDLEQMESVRRQIVVAGTLEEARARALVPVDQGLDALGRARVLMPFSRDLREAESRLGRHRLRLADASSRRQVEDEWRTVAGLDDDSLARVSTGGHGCSYSTGEVIAIVIGLILGIIPGLILMVVLC